MALPTYGDLGKSSKDVFGKGYHFGLMKLDVKTKTNNGVEFNAASSSNTDNGKVVGNLETKYKFKEHGITVTEKWNTDNNISATIDVQDQLMKGLKLTFDSSFSPATGAKSGKVKAELKHDMCTLNSDVDLNMGGPMVNASAVIGHGGWLAGYQMAFDTSKSKLTKNNFGVGFSTKDFTLHTNVNDGQVFGGSVYQRVNSQLETGVNLGWTSSNNATNFGIGCKYSLDKDANIRAKINNSSQVGLGYQQKLRDGVTLTLSTLIDGKNFNQGGHKVGVALELSA
jgi:voltage-dependent anion channel protein 2